MGHNIEAFIGHGDRINSLATVWSRSPIQLSQGLSMLFLTTELYDEITLWAHGGNDVFPDIFVLLNTAIIRMLEEHSRQGKLAYVETDYAGGVGTQSAILYENGRLKFPPIYTEDFKRWTPIEERAINIVLKELGVYKLSGKDEFDSIGLGGFRDCFNN